MGLYVRSGQDMPELLDSRKSDLEAQLERLPDELRHWELLTNTRSFEKHQSQVAALALQMRDLNEKVRKTWNKADDFVAIQKAQRDCASVERVWSYFREKLVERFDQHIGNYLRAADAYVWACYAPVLLDRRASNPAHPFREPPLVAFDTELSPWALYRRGGAAPDDSSNEGTTSVFDQVMAAMPIAVLGIPWSTAEMLPKFAALAHETGHVIEADFELADTLETAISDATKNSSLSDGWSRYWRKEVFADLFACYAAGPSFVWTLADSIPDSPATVKIKRRPSPVSGNAQWGKYPPATLRILLNLSALRTLGHEEAATEIEKYWKGDYPEHAMEDFEADVNLVAPAVYEAAKLPIVLNYTRLASEYDRVYRTAVTLNSDLELTELYNPRTLVAVASAVRRSGPDGVDKGTIWGRLQKHIVLSRPLGRLARRPGSAVAPVRINTEQIGTLLFGDDYDEDDIV
jgi:hypothetical protein